MSVETAGPDPSRLVGRDAELAALEALLENARAGLVLLVGGPGAGKGELLRELRERSAGRPCRLFPAPADGDLAPLWLVVDSTFTVDEFRSATASAAEIVPSDGSSVQSVDLVLVYGYRPSSDFHAWFTGSYLPRLRETSPPTVVVVAASAADVAGLRESAVQQIVVGPLPREAVEGELHRIDATVDDHLLPDEVSAYTEAILADPAVLGALRALLPMTTP